MHSDRDHGWAWVILIGGFCNFAFIGVLYCNGIFYVEFLDEFRKSRATTAWIGAVQSGIFNCGNLLAGVAMKYVGARMIILLGAAFTCIGFFACYFASSFWWVFFWYGLAVGVGFSLVYSPTLVLIGYYFSKYRNFAYGVVTTGVGVGTMCTPPLIEYLLWAYGWRGTMLVLSAIMANMFVFGALMRPIGTASEAKPEVVDLIANDDENALSQQGKGFLATNEAEQPATSNLIKDIKCKSTVSISSAKSVTKSITRSVIDLLDVVQTPVPANISATQTHCSTSSKDQETQNDVEKSQPEKTVSDASKLCHKLLTLPFFGLFLTGLVGGVGLMMTYVHFPAYMALQGAHSNTVAMLISLMGFTNIIGRLSSGAFTNKFPKLLLGTYSGCFIVTGIILFTGPFTCVYFPGQVIFSGLFAIFANAYCSLSPAISVDIAGLEMLHIVYGIFAVTSGLGYMAGPPLAGWLFDITGSYFYTFMTAGSCYTIGGIVIAATSTAENLKEKLCSTKTDI